MKTKMIIPSLMILSVLIGCDLNIPSEPVYSADIQNLTVEMSRFHNDSTGVAMTAFHEVSHYKQYRNGQAYYDSIVSNKWLFKAYLAGQFAISFWSINELTADSTLPKKFNFSAPLGTDIDKPFVYELDMMGYRYLAGIEVDINLKYDGHSWMVRVTRGLY